MRVANLALKFLLELAAFAALAYAGVEIGSGVWSVVLGMLFPAVAIAVWGRWNAPRSARRCWRVCSPCSSWSTPAC